MTCSEDIVNSKKINSISKIENKIFKTRSTLPSGAMLTTAGLPPSKRPAHKHVTSYRTCRFMTSRSNTLITQPNKRESYNVHRSLADSLIYAHRCNEMS